MIARVEIEVVSADCLERAVYRFRADMAHDGSVAAALFEIHRARRPSRRHKGWTTASRLHYVTTSPADYHAPGRSWSRWADVTAFHDNRWYSRHDRALPAIEPPAVPDHVLQALEGRLRPVVTIPASNPHPTSEPKGDQ